MPEYDDHTLEQIMRDGLEFRAGSAATALATPPGRDRHGVRRGRGRWIAAAAAAAVVVAGGVTFAALHDSGPDDGTVAVDPGQVPSDWRYESFDGVQVRVPPDWGWGGAPTGSGDQITSCGTDAAVVAPGTDGADPPEGTPFVGRPATMSDLCTVGDSANGRPRATAVWLGSPLPVGTDTSGPVPAQTIAVGAQHVTAFGDDAALSAEILGTAEAVEVDGNGCPTAPVRDPSPGPTDAASPTGLSVCVYDAGRLLWSASPGAQQALAYVDAFQQASATYDPVSLCSSDQTGQWVALGVAYGAAPARWDVTNFDCPALVGTYTYGQGKQSPINAPLTAGTVSPWASGGIKAYVVGPGITSADDPLASYFRGVLG
jgi:hypothetical protein